MAGIDFQTAAECARAGADAFISGTTLFQPAQPGRGSEEDAEDRRSSGAGGPRASTESCCRRNSPRTHVSIKFGTDGWRAVIAEDFTFANVARVSQAAADYWSANPVAGTEQEGHRRL